MAKCVVNNLATSVAGGGVYEKFHKMIISGVSSGYGIVGGGVSFTITPISGVVKVDGTEINAPTSFTGTATIDTTAGSAYIEDYYLLRTAYMDAKYLQYLTSPSRILLYGDLSKFDNCCELPDTLSYVRFDNNKTTNIRAAFKILSKIPALNELEMNQAMLTATMTEFGENVPLSTAILWFPFKCETITGTIEDFVHAFRGRGNTSGSISLNDIALPNVTFNGNTHGWSNTTLSWTETTITCYGETIIA